MECCSCRLALTEVNFAEDRRNALQRQFTTMDIMCRRDVAQHPAPWRMRTSAEGSFAVPMSASSHAETAPLLTRVTEVDGDRAGASIEGRAAGSSRFNPRVTNSRVAAAMALLLLALVACLGSGSGFKTAALGSGRGTMSRHHGVHHGDHVQRSMEGRGRRAGFAGLDSNVDTRVHTASTHQTILSNAPGPIPGLVDHVDAVSGATKFRLVSFCNRAYWPFLHVALQSTRSVAPDVVPYWTVIVADEGTAEFIRDKAPDLDVFVDDDLRDIVGRNAGRFAGDAEGTRKERKELRRLMSWRRIHAVHGLLEAGYTTVFLEPDVVFARDPTKVFQDVLTRADVATGSDYGVGKEARALANAKVLVAKPTAAAKALFEEWQGAEGSNTHGGANTERAYLLGSILRRKGKSGAVVEVLDETKVASYLSHPPPDDSPDDSSVDGARLGGRGTTDAVMITGGGCDDVNYKLNWLNQAVLRYALPPGPGGRRALDFEAVEPGCDVKTRDEVMKRRARGYRKAGEGGKHHGHRGYQ